MTNTDVQNPLLKAAAELRQEAESLLEVLRVKRVRDLDLAFRKLDKHFEDFMTVAIKVCGTPVSHINIIDEDHQYIKARIGGYLAPEALVSDRKDSICNITVLHPNEVTVIPDARLDPRVANSTWVRSGAIRFYAGAPLVTEDGLALGTLCVLDDAQTHHLNEDQKCILQALARIVTGLLTGTFRTENPSA